MTYLDSGTFLKYLLDSLMFGCVRTVDSRNAPILTTGVTLSLECTLTHCLDILYMCQDLYGTRFFYTSFEQRRKSG